ncbi:hypothetical protein TNCV_1413411 [Trichonephila clavipes]|nr:hypothetical protein TNCV_1413411 [Trichonephila clavipes]
MSYKNELYALVLSKQNNIASLLKYTFQPNSSSELENSLGSSASQKVIKLVKRSLASVEAAEVALLFHAFKKSSSKHDSTMG